MFVVSPIPFTSAEVLSSNLTEPSAWSSGKTDYLVGDIVAYDVGSPAQTYIYQAKIAGPANANKVPETETDFWDLVTTDTNAWSMFDAAVNTRSVVVGADLEVSVQPGTSFDTVGLLNLVGSSVTVEILDDASGAQVFSQTFSLDNAFISDWYAYFFSPFDYSAELFVTNLPPYETGVINVTIADATTAECGLFLVGKAVDLGESERGTRFGIRDYSQVQTDTDGNTTLTVGEYAKRIEGRAFMQNSQVGFVIRTLSGLRATPALWVTSENVNYSALMVYGYIRDWNVTLSQPEQSQLSYSIEGLI